MQDAGSAWIQPSYCAGVLRLARFYCGGWRRGLTLGASLSIIDLGFALF
jgi:hypothetical protein